MIRYSVAQVEALTGIKAHTLRIWERRYDFLDPMRTPTNIRYYSDVELKKLLNFGILVRNGYRVSKLDKMTDDDLNAAVSKILTDPAAQASDEMKGLTVSMLEMNEDEFNKIFERQVLRKGFLRTITESVYPFLQYVGVLWTTGKAMVAQEHFISNLVRQKLISAIDRLSLPQSGAPSIVLFILEGEEHEIGMLLANYMAKEMGWSVYYLGQSVPVVNLKRVIDLVQPDLMMTMFLTSKSQRLNGIIDKIVEDATMPLIISGNADNLAVIDESEKVLKAASPAYFQSHLVSIQAALSS